MNIRIATKKVLGELHRQYWLHRLRRAERQQEKALAHTAAVLRRMCGPAAGPHLERLYARRVHMLPLISEVLRVHVAREDLTIPEIQLVMFEFLRRSANSQAEELLV